MKKLIIMTAVLGVCAVAGAQVIQPTDGQGIDKVNQGGKSATVTQTVNLKLPEATALHLNSSELTFDIADIANNGTATDGKITWYCAYGKGDGKDVATQLDANFWNQTQVKPLGTSYTPTAGKFGEITINAGEQIKSYPPVKIENGQVDNKTKAYFVCYRSFIMQKFSNLGNFKLSVQRSDASADGRGKQLMYIQDNPCDFWGQPTGLYALPPGSVRELIPMNMTKGTTGARAAAAAPETPLAGLRAAASEDPKTCRSYTSWLDDLVVVAVVVDGDLSGDNKATLTYTLESSATPFAIKDSDSKN